MSLFRFLTAVVFAVHLMVGCCWHHAHACESQGDVQSAHGQCPDSHSGSHDSDADHSDHGPQNCNKTKCSFVASVIPSSYSFAQPSQASAAVLFVDQPSLVGGDFEQHCFPTGRLLLSVRLYLVNQVLLI